MSNGHYHATARQVCERVLKLQAIRLNFHRREDGKLVVPLNRNCLILAHSLRIGVQGNATDRSITTSRPNSRHQFRGSIGHAVHQPPHFCNHLHGGCDREHCPGADCAQPQGHTRRRPGIWPQQSRHAGHRLVAARQRRVDQLLRSPAPVQARATSRWRRRDIRDDRTRRRTCRKLADGWRRHELHVQAPARRDLPQRPDGCRERCEVVARSRRFHWWLRDDADERRQSRKARTIRCR